MAEEIVFPEFTARNYGVVIYNEKNSVMASPESFFLGNVLTTHPDKLREAFAERKKFRDESKDYTPLFAFEEPRRVWIGEQKDDGSAQRRFHNLDMLSLDNLITAISDKLRIKAKDDSILFCHGHSDPEERAISNAHGAAVMLSGLVRNYCVRKRSQKEEREESGKKHYFVQIDGAYLGSNPRFNDVRCPCSDSNWSHMDRGHSNFQAVCKHSAALLDYVSRNLNSMETYIRLEQEFRKNQKQLKIFSPFHTDSIDQDILGFFKNKELPYFSKEKNQSIIDFWKLDVLLAVLFENMGQAEVNKRLLQLPVYDLETVNLLLDGRAFFEVWPNSQLFGVDSNIDKTIRDFYQGIKNSLRNQGFSIHGYCYEKKNSEHEVIAINFLPDQENPKDAVGEVRVLFNEKYPPVIIRRTPLPGAKNYLFKEQDNSSHPYSELFRDPYNTRRFDDRKRKYDRYTVEFPQCYIPDVFLPLYAKAIHDYFPGGFKKLIQLVEANENEKIRFPKKTNKNSMIHLPKKSLVYRMEKMLK